MSLPRGWAEATIADVTDGQINQSGPRGTSFTYVDISAIDNRAKRIVSPAVLQSDVAPSRARQRLKASDVLVSMTRPNLNAVALVPPDLSNAIGSTGLCVLRAAEVEPKWLLYAVQEDSFVAAMSGRVQGALYPAVRPKDILGFTIRVPPAAEQRRIVAAIEEYLSRLDAARSVLTRIGQMLPIARASLLEAAVEGTLAGGVGVTYDATPQPLSNIIERIEAGRSFRCEERPPVSGEVGVVKVSAVSWGEFDENEAKTVRERDRVEGRFFIRKGDFLFSRANTIQLVGACVVVKTEPIDLMLSDKILRFVLRPGVSPDWLLICLRSRAGRREIERLATGNQESMRNIGQDRIKQIVVPIPNSETQATISAEVDTRLSQLAHVERTVEKLLGHAERLRQSILQCAFSGHLVSQDPRDKPADQLLDRLRSQRPGRTSRTRAKGRIA